MIDLHSHTTESDGSLSPADLVALACRLGIEALAITDHDTLSGFDQVRSLSRDLALDLICGIELSVKYNGRSVHLLAYFPTSEPDDSFRSWIVGLQESRRSRNRFLLQRLEQEGIDLGAEHLEMTFGGRLGRPHIAAAMLRHGYVESMQQAFDVYLDESAKCYVPRDEVSFEEAVERIRLAGGVSSLAHPNRITREPETLRRYLGDMQALGLTAIEAHHSNHSLSKTRFYLDLANDLQLSVTGGSDFHGSIKPDIELGTGKHGNLCLPRSIVDDLRKLARPAIPPEL